MKNKQKDEDGKDESRKERMCKCRKEEGMRGSEKKGRKWKRTLN